ncbi:metallophosphoesterase family protein [Yoonia sediminilitoris]|uniref:Calcineurin-like phosphoesterase family protein n=1 Tax=Yoonia sediminilitoris TaxID=1286148 RepID=A0A2T6KH86_9RHOB|nr:metallophosphoesterase [Yoonia sediminilitoris]PUB14879.1 calcineurin-like phosphoesterase family protein [Yoonia sediminilitoris]RCW95596.1 calcineurin-like phosphoesterase family protein [Yoonia sediminilitoris]
MADSWSGKVAVLADPHFHDTGAGHAYGLGERDCFRSLAESTASTRVFNEGGAALVRALDILVERGVRLVMIAGDLTDDGQAPNWRASSDLLDSYSQRHDMRFFLTPGNHDQWFGDGKPLRQEMVRSDGTTFVVSGDRSHETAHFAPEMFQIGQADVLNYASGFGLCRHRDDLHWESPFGTSDALENRIGLLYRTGLDPIEAPDLSYLVEPVEGLWILAIDANVYLPDANGWRDFAAEGWIAVLRHKAWLLDWIRDVSRRARESGIQLMCMSHFPVCDVLDGVPRGLAERVMPTLDVARALAHTRMGLHFSGHWNINRTGLQTVGNDWLVNVAVPSTASFPAAFKLVDVQETQARIETLRLGSVPGFDAAFEHYLAEQPMTPLAQTGDYDSFLAQHFAGLIGQRYLVHDWPEEFSASLENCTLADMLFRIGAYVPTTCSVIPMRLAVEDYYALEQGGQLAGVPTERLAVYRSFDVSASIQGTESERRLYLGLTCYSRTHPDDSFVVDLLDGHCQKKPA